MNTLTVPPSPNWYEANILACAPDNTLIYGAKNNIVILENSSETNQAADIRIIAHAHTQKVLGVNLNKNWGEPKKWAVSISDDKIVKIWDITTGKKHLDHNKHLPEKKVIAAAFAGDDRVVSVSEDGNIVVWNVAVNETTELKNVFGTKVTITCMSTCPHANWLTAFGLKSGLVVVTDIRKCGKLLYKLRGHDKAVVSLSWCPVPINIFPKNPNNYVGQKKKEEENNVEISNNRDDVKEVIAVTQDNETDLQAETHPLLKVYDSGDEEFLKECEILKNKILGTPEKAISPDDTGDSSEEKLNQLIDKSILEKTGNALIKSLEEIIGNFNESNNITDDEKLHVSHDSINKKREIDTQKPEAEGSSTETLPEKIENTNSSDEIEDKGLTLAEEGNENIQNPEGKGSSIDTLSQKTEKEKSSDKIETNELKSEKEKSSDKIETNELKSEKEKSSDKIGTNELKSEKEKSSDTTETNELKSEKEKSSDTTETNELKSEKEKSSDKIEMNELKTETEKSSDKIETNELKSEKEKSSDTIETNELKSEKENSSDKIETNELISVENINENAQKYEIQADSKQQNATEIEITSETTTENVTTISNQDLTKNEGSSLIQQAITTTKPKSPAIEEEPRKEFLLASSAKESNIYIWRAGTDGRMETFISLSGKFYNRKNKAMFDKIWIALNWVTPTMLLSSSKDFELLAWKLPKPKNALTGYSVIHSDHTALLFSISSPTVLLNEYNWKDGPKVSNAWTISQDRLLINSNIIDKTILSHYPTLGGNIECMQLSPLDPNRLAIGSVDSSVRVWDLSRPHTTNILMTNFYHKIQSKVSALAWHPTNESILAYATAEGRVGYVDPNTKSKPSVLLSPYFKSQIYKLEWAPINGNQEKFGLYAVGEGCIVYFNLENKAGRDPTVIPTPEDTFIYSFGWKPDYSQLFVVARAGFIIVYSPKLKMICKHYFSYRIHDIIWHPNASDNTSDYHNWLATIGSLKNVFVYKFDIECGNNDDNVINFYQSESEINAVVWSPYVPSQMMVSCEMGIIQIWDVVSAECLATFINCNNYEPVTAAIWSPIDPDYVISSGKDNTLKIWKISEHPPLNEKEIAAARKIVIKEISTNKSNGVPKKEENDAVAIKDKRYRSFLLPKFYYLRGNSITSDLRKLFQWKEDPESVTPMSTHCPKEVLNIFGSDETMREIIEKNVTMAEFTFIEYTYMHLMYGMASRNFLEARRLYAEHFANRALPDRRIFESIDLRLRETENCLKQKGKHVLSTTLSLFRGDITAQVKEAIDEKRVDRWIISLAPMASTKLWQLACETYADQLSEEPGADAVEIATYYLACHKVQKAIDVLCEVNMHREAYTLVKCRMLGKEAEQEILGRWAKQAEIDGNFEQAAQCLISMDKYENAASLLIRRSDINILEFAVELTSKIDNEQLHSAAVSKLKQVKEILTKEKSNDIPLPTIQDAVLEQNISKETVNGEQQLDDSQNSSCINTESEEMFTAASVSDPNISVPEDTSDVFSENTPECASKSENNSQELINETEPEKESTENYVEVQKVETD